LSLELHPAHSLSIGERAELFTAAYEGYVVPMLIDETALAWMQEKFDFDLEASRVAYRNGEPVGLANLAVRGRDAWIGGVGVVAPARRAGVGEALMRAVHEEARSRGVERVWLEVIVENTRAFALYEKLGYELVQDVEVWTLPAAEGEHAGREVAAAEAKAQLPERHEPWQRADGTLAHYDDLRGLVTDTGAMLFCVRSSAQLQQYAGEPEPLLGALRAFGDVYVLNLPAEDPAASVLRELGGSVVLRQHEMLLELPPLDSTACGSR
jgi:GNAT superfamily N-acetyltransferase